MNQKNSSHLHNGWFLVIGIVAVGIDQVTKYAAFHGELSNFLNAFRPIFEVLLSQNYNFAFGIALPHSIAYIFYALVMVGFSAWYFTLSTKNNWQGIGYSLIILGAISNLVDRFVFGYVRDFVLAIWGNIFNFADVCIIAGIIMILYSEFFISNKITVINKE